MINGRWEKSRLPFPVNSKTAVTPSSSKDPSGTTTTANNQPRYSWCKKYWKVTKLLYLATPLSGRRNSWFRFTSKNSITCTFFSYQNFWFMIVMWFEIKLRRNLFLPEIIWGHLTQSRLYQLMKKTMLRLNTIPFEDSGDGTKPHAAERKSIQKTN